MNVNLCIIFIVFLLSKLKKNFKNKLDKVELVVDKNFKSLENNINSKIIDKNGLKNAKISIAEENNVLEKTRNIEGKIIKEVEEIKKEI